MEFVIRKGLNACVTLACILAMSTLASATTVEPGTCGAGSPATKAVWDLVLQRTDVAIRQCANRLGLPQLSKSAEFLQHATIACDSDSRNDFGVLTNFQYDDWVANSPLALEPAASDLAPNAKWQDWETDPLHRSLILFNRNHLARFSGAYLPIGTDRDDSAGAAGFASTLFHESLHYLSRVGHTGPQADDAIYILQRMCFPPAYFSAKDNFNTQQCAQTLSTLFNRHSSFRTLSDADLQRICTKPWNDAEIQNYSQQLHAFIQSGLAY